MLLDGIVGMMLASGPSIRRLGSLRRRREHHADDPVEQHPPADPDARRTDRRVARARAALLTRLLSDEDEEPELRRDAETHDIRGKSSGGSVLARKTARTPAPPGGGEPGDGGAHRSRCRV